MDFMVPSWRITKRDMPPEIYPKFRAKTSKDLMTRGGDFYAIWNEQKGLWSTSQNDATDLIDAELYSYKSAHPELSDARVLTIEDADTKMIDKWRHYVTKQLPEDHYMPLDETLIFQNSPVRREDYASKRLPYALAEGDTSAYDELMSTLYSPAERHKIEWAIGAVVSGDSKFIQKFLVFYGSAGTGKSTVLNIIQQLFDGYYTTFDAKALGSGTDSFALEPFKTNPLVAIQHDGDLSRIEDNTRLNSVVSHEEMTVNEKFKSQYTTRFKAMLFMGTNKPVKITDSKSGIIRRLIDVSPTDKKLPIKRYRYIVEQIGFELGAIAWHCLQVYQEDKYAYEDYIPKSMIGATNDFYNFIEEMFDDFVKADEVTLNMAWSEYKKYCEEARIPYPYKKTTFKEELRNYFKVFEERGRDKKGNQQRNIYRGFRIEKFWSEEEKKEHQEEEQNWLIFNTTESLLDKMCADQPAQYASERETPLTRWDNVNTVLADLDTSKVHYVRLPLNHIVIDFDLKDNGKKSLDKNMEAASKWPKTYAEISKGGSGVHLHYIYKGDPMKLSRIYDENIEIKVFSGYSSLRRRLSKCNDIPVAEINSGLPLKGDDNKVVNFDAVKNEKAIRTMIRKNLKKEYHPYTKPSIDFIYQILEDAYASGAHYDVSDLRPVITAFALKSSNNAQYCNRMVARMKFKSEEPSDYVETDDQTPVFFDVEVFPNLVVIVYKPQGKKAVTMINPSPDDVKALMKRWLVGFNNRKYDNHILYAIAQGYDTYGVYKLSQRIINKESSAFFGEAYNVSGTDIYDFSSKKQSLKKWEIEMRIHHQELGLPWDEPVDEKLWPKVAEYCVNDVEATAELFEYLKDDWTARQILAALAGLTVNDTTNTLTGRIIFGTEKHPQSEFVYTDLSEMFPGYEFNRFGIDQKRYTGKIVSGKSIYRGEDPGEGGRVFAVPGMYENVALLDVASMHPSSIILLNLFGDRYTQRYAELKQARVYIKHGEYEKAAKLFDGKLAPYLTDKTSAKALSNALKIALNSVYGLTSANFDNLFKDPRNEDNIVAKRGALFMIDLQKAVEAKGFIVAHVKTDSIKVPNATPEIISFVMDFGKKYGYEFEHEATYEKLCLVNEAVYVAKDASDGHWTATGTQFQIPYVFKTLFSKEPIEFEDLCEAKSVTTALYLDMNEKLPNVEAQEAELGKLVKKKKQCEKDQAPLPDGLEDRMAELEKEIAKGHNYIFIGKTGLFCPMKDGCGAGVLVRKNNNGGYTSATGAKGYRWMEAEMVRQLGLEDQIDRRYYDRLVDDAVASISEYGDFEQFAE